MLCCVVLSVGQVLLCSVKCCVVLSVGQVLLCSVKCCVVLSVGQVLLCSVKCCFVLSVAERSRMATAVFVEKLVVGISVCKGKHTFCRNCGHNRGSLLYRNWA